jgi:hypothetical protein
MNRLRAAHRWYSVGIAKEPLQETGLDRGNFEAPMASTVVDVGSSGARTVLLLAHPAGKTHSALGLGLAACQKGYSVAFMTAAALVHELMEARDDNWVRHRHQ